VSTAPTGADKVLFITGAGSGIGLLTAQRALASGWSVAALDVNLTGLNSLGDSPKLLKLVVDITDAAALDAAVDQAEAALGAISRVVNAAAIMPLGELLKQDRALILRIMNINYGGLVNLAGAVLPRLLARGKGQFVSYSSIAGSVPTIYMGAYNASKFAVTAFTEVLYHENRSKGVQFVMVCPPPVATPLLKQARDTVWPKMLDQAPPLTAEAVIDAVEGALASGQFLVIPGGAMAQFYAWLRRFSPKLIWYRIHQVEGR